MQGFRSPRWLPGGNLQTLWTARFARAAARPPAYRRERWSTPDGDFIDVDLLAAPRLDAPWLVLFHGLEGSSGSPYALAFAEEAAARGWHCAVPHFRGCSGTPNLAPRAYHSGDFEEIAWILARLRERADEAGARGGFDARLYAVGISLGGNALLRWAAEAGEAARAVVRSLAAVSAPVDLTAAGHAIGRGFNRWVYTRVFLATMKPKALAQWQRHPGLFDRERVARARTLHEFDDAFTAPLHGFAGVEDYWARASAKPHLARIRLPALVLNARNDPFVPAASLPTAHEAGPHVTLWQPPQGGHVGFASGPFPGRLDGLAQAVAGWLERAGA